RPDIAPVIGTVLTGNVAEAAGLRPGDRVVSIDGRPIRVWEDLVATVQARPGKNVRLLVSRGAEELEIHLQPRAERQNGQLIGRIGASPQMDPESMKNLVTTVRYAPATALGMAF